MGVFYVQKTKDGSEKMGKKKLVWNLVAINNSPHRFLLTYMKNYSFV